MHTSILNIEFEVLVHKKCVLRRRSKAERQPSERSRRQGFQGHREFYIGCLRGRMCQKRSHYVWVLAMLPDQ